MKATSGSGAGSRAMAGSRQLISQSDTDLVPPDAASQRPLGLKATEMILPECLPSTL